MSSETLIEEEKDQKDNFISNKPFVSIIVPAFNEAAILENNLSILYDYMTSIEDKYDWELIVINDGSTDNTGDIADMVAQKKDNMRVLHHMYNFRLGQALRYAFNNCSGDHIVTMDIDLSYSVDHIEKLLAKIKETRAKIVVASPYMKGGKVSNVPWFRKTMSKWANIFLSLTVTTDIFSDKLKTLTGMVRAYDREFLSRLNLKAMDVDIHPEIIYKAMILRACIVEIPAHLDWGPQRKGGAKRKSSMRILRGIISNILSGFMFRPFMFFIVPGLILMALASYPIAWTLFHTLSYYGKVTALDGSTIVTFSAAVAAAFRLSPQSFIVGGIALMISIQLISLGLIALQNKRYYEELFHISSSIYSQHQQKAHIIRSL